MSLQTLFQALAFDGLKVMTPDGHGRLVHLHPTRDNGWRAAVRLSGTGNKRTEFSALSVRPILKGFQDFRNECINGTSEIIGDILGRITAKIGPHQLTGLFELPLAAEADQSLGLESELMYPGSDGVLPRHLGRLRITESLELYWQPSAEDLRADVDASRLGWIPLHLSGLSAWLHAKGYAAEMPQKEYMTPAFAKLLQNDASKRKMFFEGFTSN